MWIRRNRDDRGQSGADRAVGRCPPPSGPQAANPDKRLGCPWGRRPGCAHRRAGCGTSSAKSHDAGRHRPCDRRAGMLIEQTPAATIETARSHCARYFGTAWQLSRADAAGIGVVWPNLAIMGALGGAFLAAAVSRLRAMLARQT